MYASLNGYFDKFQPEAIQTIEVKFLEYVKNLHVDLLESLKTEKQITDEIENQLKTVIGKFIESTN